MGQNPPKKAYQYSEEVEGTGKPGESPHYISTKSAVADTSLNSMTSAKDILEFATKRFPNNNCLGSREKLPNGAYGQYKWLTYSQVLKKIQKLGSVLRLNQFVQRNEDGHSFLGIYAGTCLEWTLFDLACVSSNIITVPIYDNLQANALEFVINQTGLKVIAASNSNVEKILKLAEEGKIPSLTSIIQFQEGEKDEIRLAKLGIRVYSLQEVENLEAPQYEDNEERDVFTFCYTSGTTGMGKAAMITNSNLVESCKKSFSGRFYNENDTYFSFLPLAHIMERVALYHMIVGSTAIGYYHGDILKITEDIVELKPTMFVSVPRLLMRFHDGIKNSFATTKGLKGKLIKKALQVKWARYKSENAISHGFFDKLVFNKVKNLLGGKVQCMGTGSAAISSEVMGFLRIVFSSHIFEGYGQTETTSGVLYTEKKDFSSGHVGGMASGMLAKIVDVPEMNYLSTDKDSQGHPMPRGELCLKGPMIFKGYYKDPEKTAEAFDSEGWLRTGDIVKRNYWNGSFSIIDRKNNCFKLQQGEYVAAEKVQLYYQKSPFVMQCFVDGNSLQRYPVAVVVPNEEFIRNVWKGRTGIDLNHTFEELCKMKKVKDAILEDMERVAEESGFFGYERVKNIYLESRPWTPADLLTPTMKLKRFEAKNKYREIVNQLYSE